MNDSLLEEIFNDSLEEAILDDISTNTHSINDGWEPITNDRGDSDDCGTGAGGFKKGNTCASGGGGGGRTRHTGGQVSLHEFLNGPRPNIIGTGYKGKITVKDGMEYLQSLSKNNISVHSTKVDGKPKGPTPEEISTIAKSMAKDVLYAYKETNAQAGWYDKDIKDTLNELSKIYPEIAKDPDHRFIMSAAMAITSPGNFITSNLRDAAFVYEEWVKSGKTNDTRKFFIKNGFAVGQNTIPESAEIMQKMIDEVGIKRVAKLLDSEIRVKDLSLEAQKLFPNIDPKEFGVGGEGVNTKVPGFAIFGPKVGAFYANIRGNFNPVTIDMWEMRHLGAIGGTAMVAPTKKQVQSRAEDIRSFLHQIKDWRGVDPKAFKEELKRMEKTGTMNIIDGPVITWADAQAKWYGDATNFGKINPAVNRTPLNLGANQTSKSIGKITDAPGNGSTRNNVREIFRQATDIVNREKRGGPEVTPAEVQAVSWTFIQRAMQHTGARVKIDMVDPETKLPRPNTFSEGARMLVRGSIQRRYDWGKIKKKGEEDDDE